MESHNNQKETYNKREFKAYKQHRLNKIKPYIPWDRKIKILDVGCGDGSFFDSILEYRTNLDCHGTDISRKQCKIATSKGYNIKQSDVSQGLDYQDNTFDIVISTEVIEHIFNTDRFLTELKRVVKPKGLVIITTPNIANLGNRIRLLLFGQRPSCIDFCSRQGTSGHIRAFDIYDMQELFNNNGLKIIKLMGREFYLPFKLTDSKVANYICKLMPNICSGFIIISQKE